MRIAASTLWLGVLISCSAAKDSSAHVVTYERGRGTPSLQQLVDSLARLPGEFHQVGGQWRFDGDQSVFGSFAEHGDSAVAALVGCLGRTAPATATVDGRRVLVGAMCGKALHQTAYPTRHENGPGGWDGVVHPTATADELRAAKAAWQQVIASGRYKLS